MEYLVESKWTGWFGGFGSEGDIAAIMNRRGQEGWRLVRTEAERFAWMWMPWFLRVKLLMVWERPRTLAAPESL